MGPRAGLSRAAHGKRRRASALATPVPCLGGVRGSSPQEEGRPAPGRVPKAPQTQPVPRLREAQPFAVPGPGDVFLQEVDVEDTEVSWMVSRWPPHKAS